MTNEQLKQATKIHTLLTKSKEAYSSLMSQIDFDKFEKVGEEFCKSGLISQYNVCVSAHDDGSGFNINMKGAHLAEEILLATKKVLEDRINILEQQFSDI